MVNVKILDKNTHKILNHTLYSEDIFAIYDATTKFTFGDENIVLLYSKLYDSKDQEICQGDILKIDDLIYRVVFKNGCFLIVNDDKNTSGKLLFSYAKDSEIIGNMINNKDIWSEWIELKKFSSASQIIDSRVDKGVCAAVERSKEKVCH